MRPEWLGCAQQGLQVLPGAGDFFFFTLTSADPLTVSPRWKQSPCPVLLYKRKYHFNIDTP